MNISRLYTFLAGTPANAAEVNAEFDQLVTMFNTQTVQVDGSKSMTGPLNLVNADPTLPNHATRKTYADGLITTHLANAVHGGGGGGGSTWVRATADTLIGVTVTTIPALNITLAANTVYRIRGMFLMTAGASTTGAAYCSTLPSGASFDYSLVGCTTAPASSPVAEASHRLNGTTPPGSTISTFWAGTTPSLWRIEGIANIGATAGVLGWSGIMVNYEGAVKTNSMMSYRAIA